MTRKRLARLLGLALAVPALGLMAAAVQSAPAPKSKADTETADRVEAEPIDGTPQKLAAARMKSSNNLKQIGLAMHIHVDAHKGAMPADIVDKDGKPLLSWRVRLLPYIEQGELYKQFKLDEPWDSSTNKALLEKMPSTLVSPRVTVKKAGYTVYQVFAGPGTAFEPGKQLKFLDTTDGLSNTLFAVEATSAVPWTKPADIPFDPKADVPGFGKAYADMPLGALLDGSVRTLNLGKLTPQTLKAAITRNGGEVLGADW
jgi:hypothetical protein